MKKTFLLMTLALGVVLAGGCKDDESPSTPTSPPALTGAVRAVCESVGLAVEAGALVGGNDCNKSFNYSDDETCGFAPVDQSFSANCEGTDPTCGASFTTASTGSVDFLPEFDSSTGGLSAVRVRGSVSGEFAGSLGDACGQIGNRVNSVASVSITVEVVDDPVTANLTGTLSFGASKPLFTLTSSEGFEIRNPETGQSFSESLELQPGTYKFTVRLQADPQFNAGLSSGDFNLILRFE